MSPRPYRLGARTASVAENRDRVVTAARGLFASLGYHGVSIDEVARLADVARATVYHQFGSKLGLLEAVVADFEQRAGLTGLARLIESGPPDRLIRATVRAGCTYWATDPALVRNILPVAATDAAAADLLSRHDAGRLRLLRVMVDRLSAARLLRPDCPPERAVDTLWLVTSFDAYDQLARGRKLPTATAARILTEIAEYRITRA